MKKYSCLEIVIWVVSALPLAAALVCLPFLPDTIPMHWGADGRVDGYGGPAGLLIMAGSGLGLALLLKFLPLLDPKRGNYEKFARAYRALRLMFGLFYCVMTGLMLAAAFSSDASGQVPWLNMGGVTTAALGVLLCVMGNFMPKFRHNYFCGVRTPWALADEENWRRTHRFAGPVWFYGGLALVVCAVFLRGELLATAGLCVALVIGLAPMVYSYLIFRKSGPRR